MAQIMNLVPSWSLTHEKTRATIAIFTSSVINQFCSVFLIEMQMFLTGILLSYLYPALDITDPGNSFQESEKTLNVLSTFH